MKFENKQNPSDITLVHHSIFLLPIKGSRNIPIKLQFRTSVDFSTILPTNTYAQFIANRNQRCSNGHAVVNGTCMASYDLKISCGVFSLIRLICPRKRERTLQHQSLCLPFNRYSCLRLQKYILYN